MRRTVKSLVTLVTVLLLVFVAGCIPAPAEITPAPAPTPEPTPAPTPTVEQGTIEIRVTDPPPPGVASAYVTLTKLEVHLVSDNESGWITIIEEEVTFDLMTVIGVEEILGSANVTAGKYTQIRAEVTGVEGKTTDNVSYTAEVPSGKLKFVRPFNVEAGKTTVLTLDFDGDKSLVMTGKDKFLFKPVVKLLVSEAPVAPVLGAPLALEITTTSLPDGEVGTDYTATVEAIGGTEPYTWSIDGNLPDGLELDSDTGVISGNSTAEGDYEFTVQVEDSSDPVLSSTEEFSIDIETAARAALEITPTSLPDGEVGEAYTATLEATEGTEPYTWSISDGSLPDGLTLDSATGVISGTPTTEGDYSFTVQVQDSSDPVLSDTEEFSIDIETEAPAALEITTTGVDDGQVGVAYTDTTLEATGGTQPYTWSISDGSLPDGLTLDSATGVISGTPTMEGDYSFTVQVEDSSDPVLSDTEVFSIHIENGP